MKINITKNFKNFFSCLLLCCLLSINGYSQSDQHLSIGIGPFGLLDPITPSLNIHLESKITAKYRIDAAYGLDLNFDTWAGWHPNPEGRHHEYKLCLKKMIDWNEEFLDISYYIGIEYFGILNHYSKTSDQFVVAGEKFLFDSAEVSRNINGLRIKYGVQSLKTILVLNSIAQLGFAI